MARILGLMIVGLLTAACSEVHYSDSEMSNIDVPRDHKGDVDEPIIK